MMKYLTTDSITLQTILVKLTDNKIVLFCYLGSGQIHGIDFDWSRRSRDCLPQHFGKNFEFDVIYDRHDYFME